MKGPEFTMIGMRAGIIFAAFTTLQLAPVAATTADPLRCHARQLMCDSRYEDAMARCDQIAERQATRAADAATRVTSCENAADVRHGKCLARVQAQPVCTGTPPDPSPHACAADQLQIGANFMLCEDRCDRRDDPTQCDSNCLDRCRQDLSETRSSPICADGPVVVIQGLDETP